MFTQNIPSISHVVLRNHKINDMGFCLTAESIRTKHKIHETATFKSLITLIPLNRYKVDNSGK